jgi:hypothetical protein
LIAFYDHGNVDKLAGSHEEVAFDLENADLLVDRDVYTVACLSAAKLGKKAVENGCNAYWGYTLPNASILKHVSMPEDETAEIEYSPSLWIYRRHDNNGILGKLSNPDKSWRDMFDHTHRVDAALLKELFERSWIVEGMALLLNDIGLALYTKEEEEEKKKVEEEEKKAKEEKERAPCFGIFGR